MKKMLKVLAVAMLSCGMVSASTVDFGAFSLDFVDITGDASSANGTALGSGKTFTDTGYDYQMGVHEITQWQFDAFRSDVGFANNMYYSNGYNHPSNNTSWFEVAQFVNWLNRSQGYQSAYDITRGALDVNGSTFNSWDSSVAANGGTNLYRHKDAVFFIPSEDEWVKAAYWNGTVIQTYTTVGLWPTQAESNFYDFGYAVGSPGYFWDVGSGGVEINGTYDMMGNVWEWMESPVGTTYGNDAKRSLRGGAFHNDSYDISVSVRTGDYPSMEVGTWGFRVATKSSYCINPPISDLDGDCIVGLSDFSIFISEWLECGLSSGCP